MSQPSKSRAAETDVAFAKHFNEVCREYRWRHGVGPGVLPPAADQACRVEALLLTIYEEVKEIRRELQSDLPSGERVGDSLKRTFERVVSGEHDGPTRISSSHGERVRDSEEDLKEV